MPNQPEFDPLEVHSKQSAVACGASIFSELTLLLITFPGQYKRTPCYVLTETFDEYVKDHADGDLDRSLYVRLRHESTYDWWEDPTTRGYFWPIVWCIFAVVFTCVSLVCLVCLVCHVRRADATRVTNIRGKP